MAIREAGIRLSLQGGAEYKAGLKGISQELKTMASESRLAVAQLGNNAGITETYNTRVKGLGDQMKVTSERTKKLVDRQRDLPKQQENLTKAIEATNKAHKASQTETKRLKSEYDQLIATQGRGSEETKEAQKAWRNSQKETKALAKELNSLEVAYNQNSKELEKLPNELAKAELATQRLRNEAEKLHTEWRNSGGRLADTAKSWQEMGSKITSVGNAMKTAGGYMTTRFTMPIVTGFGMAVKEAAAFESQMGAMLPLIAEGGNITAEHRQQVEELGIASREMAIDYGKSTTDINAGMAELIRNGYTSAQVLGMVPNVLDASIASGEEFGVVMGTTANVLSQFQLRGKDTNETLTNTQRVVDSLTYVANATSSGFYDLGQGMSYIGPVANTLNMSVEETASILGILSDNGIEASQGGTALRGALTRLLKPSKQNYEAMQELGISVEDYKAGLIDFPTILDTIAENTKNLTDEQKAALIAQAFGTESQSAMNALVSAGGDALRDMTEAAEGATGATKEIADAIKETPEFQFQQSLAQLRDVGIEIGSKLLPHVTNAISVFGDWLESFNELSDSTQDFIIKAGLVVAAVGPILSVLGKLTSVTGTTVTGIGKLIQWFGKITTPKGITDTAIELGKIPGAASSAGGAASLFSNPWVIAGGLAIAGVAGFVAYMNNEAKKPFEAHNSAVESTNGAYQEWFDAMIAGMDTIDQLHNEAKGQADDTTQNYQENIDLILGANQKVQEAIALTQDKGGMFGWLTDSNQTEIEVGAERITLRMTKLSDSLKELGQSESEVTRLNNAFTNYGTTLGTVMANVITVTEEGKAVTHEWAGANIQAVKEVSTETVARLQEKRQAEIDALNQTRDNTNMEQQMYQERLDAINSSYDQQVLTIEQAQANIQAILSNASEEQRALSDQDVVHILQNMQEIATGTGKSLSEVEGVAQLIGNNLSALVSTVGLDFLVQAGLIDEAMAQNIAGVEDADVKTRLLSEALGEYAGINVEPKSLDVNATGMDELERLVSLFGIDFASLTDEEKEALVNTSGAIELTDLIAEWGHWGAGSNLEAKQAVIESDQALSGIKDILVQTGQWNNLELLEKILSVDSNAEDVQGEVASLISEWTGIPVEEVKSFMTDSNAGDTATEVAEFGGAVGSVPPQTEATFSAGVGGVSEATETVQGYSDAAHSVPESKSSEVKSNIFSTIANTVALLAYNTATSLMKDKSVTAETSTPNMLSNTLLVVGYNSATDAMKNKSSTLTTSVPNIASNTALVWSWINALNSATNRTSTLTTVHRTVRENVGFAEGGHIDAYADGGHVKWGGMFATGGKVPSGYMGIVGEAGPELFHVSKRGVSITPLAPGEKMRGVEGAIEDYMGGRGGGDINLTVNIDKPVLSKKEDINSLTNQIVRKASQMLAQQAKNKRKGRPAW